MIQKRIYAQITMTQNLKLLRPRSHFTLQKSARHYSITFLLLGSIVAASQIYAEQNRLSVDQSAFMSVFSAEFALKRGHVHQALNTYQYLVEYYNLPNLNERALNVALEVDDIHSALKVAKLWVDHYPDDVPALFYLAHISLRANQYGLAAQTLDRILEIDPNANLEKILEGIYPESSDSRQELLRALNQINKNNPSLLVMIAGLEAQAGQFDAALAKVNAALRKRPNTPSFVILKANLYFASNQPEAAFEWLERTQRYQKTPDVGLFEVQHLIKQNQTANAQKKLKKMLKKWPNNEQLLFLAGITSIDLKNFDQAAQFLQRLQASSNYQDQANYYLAVNAERKQDYAKAIALYAAVDGNFYTVSRKSLAAIYLKQGRPADAMRFLTQERVSHPHQASFLYQLQAQLLQQMDKKQRAIDLLSEAIQQMPDDPDLIYTQVILFDPLQDRQRLDQALDRLLEIEPNSPTFLNAYAYTLARQNRKLDIARKYAEEALSYAPKQASILDTLGFIAFLQKDYQAAVQILAEAYTLSPTLNIGIRYAKALHAQGDIKNFVKVYDELQIKFPQAPELLSLQPLLTPQISRQVS